MSARTPPPGQCSDVTSQVTVVLAPHYDDEVLGCGGLVARLASAGTRVHVVFLTDGSGGVEDVADREAYARTRRDESAEATRALGVASSEHLGLRDGSLESSLERLREGIERALIAERPDLLLLPSPLELTGDHRAVVAALHRSLTGLRSGDALLDAVAQLRVLLYEVNHPAHPDLLVDVSRQRAAIEGAMAFYTSQLERHAYLDAAIGLRRWRCLTLPPEVELAEAYRSLRLVDFRTRSLAQLIAEVGGAPEIEEVREGPLVSVVVRTKDRPALLAQALASIAASSYRRLEVVLVNDGGAPASPPDGFGFPLARVDLDSNRGRAAAANAGLSAARGSHVLFLDDDDLFAPEHVETLVRLAESTRERVVYTDAAVGVYTADADAPHGWRQLERSLPYSRDFDPDLLLLDNYIPFNTVLVERSLYEEVGPFDETLEFFEDWDLLIRLSRLARFRHLARVTCEYRHFRGGAHALGEAGESRADFAATKARVLAKHQALITSEAVARAVIELRRESVIWTQAAESLRARVEALERDYHRNRGELESVREENERRRQALLDHDRDFDRLHREEATLRRGLEEQIEHLGRTYAEIERLNRLTTDITADRDRRVVEIEQMKATRAWRFHAWWHRIRS